MRQKLHQVDFKKKIVCNFWIVFMVQMEYTEMYRLNCDQQSL